MESEQTGLALSLPPSPEHTRGVLPVEFSHDYLCPSPEARKTVSFGLDYVIYTAASDSEDFGPASADALPPACQEAQPSAAYSELIDVLSCATEKLVIDWPDEPCESQSSKLDERSLSGPNSRPSGLFGEADNTVVDKFRATKSQSAALRQFMPRRVRDSSIPSSSLPRERSSHRKESVSRRSDPIHPPPTMVWGACGRPLPRQRPHRRLELKRPTKPSTPAPSSRSLPSCQKDESFPCLPRLGQTVQAFLPTSHPLSSSSSITSARVSVYSVRSASPLFVMGDRRRTNLSPLTADLCVACCSRNRRRAVFSRSRQTPYRSHRLWALSSHFRMPGILLRGQPCYSARTSSTL
ncbi:hypothetical protein ABG768_020006 [Culter alburnus]|uniref:Uncharacterized protein n=1 Tax=Culter alburnus TaxID=194366 RepID=A0AAW2AZP9_CULAL